jgi:protein phosphatase 2C family protein 2/3
LNKNQEIVDRSGSCAIFALIVEDICYMANIGDSRGIMSTQNGKKIICLTNDHKPNDEKESKRIMDNGGKVYQ